MTPVVDIVLAPVNFVPPPTNPPVTSGTNKKAVFGTTGHQTTMLTAVAWAKICFAKIRTTETPAIFGTVTVAFGGLKSSRSLAFMALVDVLGHPCFVRRPVEARANFGKHKVARGSMVPFGDNNRGDWQGWTRL